MEIPANVKSVIEKTAGYVFKNGKSFEDRLKKNSGSDQFQFLNDLNEYHSYYQQQLAALRTESEPGSEVSESTASHIAVGSESPSEPISVRNLQFLTKWEQPPSAFDDHIIKLTAMYVARNGDDYGPALHEHQKTQGNGAQFAFMVKGHTYYENYIKYVQNYRKIIQYMTEDGLLDGLLDSESLSEPLINGYLRAMYRKQNRQARKKTEERERERQRNFASIDWQDFLFVARIEFDAIDQVKELAVPITRESLIHRSLQAKAQEVEPTTAPTSEKQVEKASPEADDDTNLEEIINEEEEVAPQQKVFKGMKIRAAGESRLKKKNTTKEATIKCPLTGKQIPALQFESHIQVLLRDPRYKEQQDNYIRKNFSHASNITTDQVYENILRLTNKKRPEEDNDVVPKTKKVQYGPL